MNYERALEYIYSTSWMGSILGLSRMKELMRRLGNPQDQIPSIHIAGTNGKGSTAAMLASILTKSGYRTGLYTSPAIHYFGERMMIDGQPIPESEVARLTDIMREAALGMEQKPTEYELITTLSFLYFASNCDIAVIETGMGGSLDATNVIQNPVVSIITAIGLDHIRELGGTVEAIAEQKAGIIKPNRPVVISEQEDTVLNVIKRIAVEKGAEWNVASCREITALEHSLDSQRFLYQGIEYQLALLGEYQLKNAATALKTVDVLRFQGWNLPVEAVQEGLAGVKWPGRFEIMQKSPVVVLDGAHNPQGAESLKENLCAYFPGKKYVMIIGILADKAYNEVVEDLSKLPSRWIAVTPKSDRALPAAELADTIRSMHPEVSVIEDMEQALAYALESVSPDEIICVFGTLTLIDEVRRFFHKL